MRIGITYNLKDEISPGRIMNNESSEEFDSPATIKAIGDVFEKHGYTAIGLGGDLDVIEKIKRENVEFVFNLAEGLHGRNRESHIPSILEMMNIPYSGSDVLTLGLTLDKIITKKISAQAGIPVPRYIVAHTVSDTRDVEKKLEYPLITKPAWEGSSKGIYDNSKVYNKADLEENVKFLINAFPGQPVLVEEYIEGREVTVGVIGNTHPEILGVMEIASKVNPGGDVFYSLETKRDWKTLIDYKMPPELNRLLLNHLTYRALSAYKEFNCRDIARIDFRVSEKKNRLFMLEVNPLPGLSPEYGDLVIMAKMRGISYEDLIMSIFKHALKRYRANKVIFNHEKV